MKKIFVDFSVGVTIGVMISIIFNFAYNRDNFVLSNPVFYDKIGNVALATLICVLLYGTLGVIGSYSTKIYDNENNDTLVKKTIKHYFLILSIVTIINIIVGNISISLLGIIAYIIIFTIIYAVIWIVSWNITKKDVKDMNEKINKLNK